MRTTPPPIKAPTDRAAFALFAVAVLALVATFATGAPALGVVLAALMGYAGMHQLVVGRAAVRTHASLQAITRGQIAEAEAHLHAVPRWAARNGAIMRSVGYQRGLIALYRGDAAAATAVLEPASGARTNLFTQTQERLLRAYVLSVRALAFASLGDATRARADVAAVLDSEHALPDAIARAHLAQAVMLARAAAHDELATFFRDHGSLVLEHTLPRERILARALRKMITSRTRSVYREAARPEADSSEATAIGDWVARMAPEAAPHASAGSGLAERSDAAAPPAISDEALRAVEAARKQTELALPRQGPPNRARLTLVLWFVLVLLFLLAYQFFGTPTGPTHATDAQGPSPATAWLTAIGLVGPALIAIIAFAIRRNRKTVREIVAASRAVMLHDMESAEPLLRALEKSTQNLGAAHALLLRATIAEREANFAECVTFCDRGLAAVAAQPAANRVVASLTVTPALEGLRGYALAALGRDREATATLATLGKTHASWAHRASSELRIRLVLAVKNGDLEGARAIARERTPALPITLRDETLADLLLATAPHGASREEQERVDTEIREDLTIRTWIDAVAPDVRAELARRVSGTNARIDAPEDEEVKADEIERVEEETEGGPEAAIRRA